MTNQKSVTTISLHLPPTDNRRSFVPDHQKKLRVRNGGHHQECPIRLGKFSRMRNHSISKTATAELGRARARLACSSINTCAVGPIPDETVTRSQQPALYMLQTAAETTAGGSTGKEDLKADRRVRHYKEVGLQRMATRWSSHHPACSVRYQSLHVSSSANDSFKKFTGARSRRPHHSHFSHGRQNRRSSFCRCGTVREEVRI